MNIDDAYETIRNLTDKQIEPAARALFDLCDRGNPRGYIPFEQATEDEYNDYMTMAQYAVEGFLKGLAEAEDD